VEVPAAGFDVNLHSCMIVILNFEWMVLKLYELNLWFIAWNQLVRYITTAHCHPTQNMFMYSGSLRPRPCCKFSHRVGSKRVRMQRTFLNSPTR